MKQIKLGIIGLGNIAEKHLDVISKIKKFKIYSINSKTNKNSVYFKKKYSVTKIAKSYLEMINDKNIDAFLLFIPADKSYKVIERLIISKKIFLQKNQFLIITKNLNLYTS